MASEKNKQWRFGLRDVFLWTLVVCLACGWLADRRRAGQQADKERLLYGNEFDQLRHESEVLRRYIEDIRPPDEYRAGQVHATCSKCGTLAANRSPLEAWYSWAGTWFCKACAEDYGVDIGEQASAALRQKP